MVSPAMEVPDRASAGARVGIAERRLSRAARRPMSIVHLLVLVGVWTHGLNAWAKDAASCRGAELDVKGASGPWVRRIEEARARVRQAPDIDPCARLSFTAKDNEMIMRVVLADGRTAVRRILRPEDLLETVTAVLLLPRRPQPPKQELESNSNIVMPTAVPVAGPELTRDAKPELVSAHLELGAGAAARISGGPAYAGAGASAFANVLLDPWLLGVFARWDAVESPLSSPPSGFNMQTFALGVQMGFRKSLGGLSLDGMIGPEMLVESQEADGPDDGIGGDVSDVRLEFGLRLSGPRRSRMRLYAAGGIDASPARIRRAKQLDPGLPPLPSWSSGLTLGLMWSAF